MESPTDLPGKQTLDSTTLAGGSKQQVARTSQTRRYVAIILWIIGFIALVVASVIVHSHPAPWPLEVQTTTSVWRRGGSPIPWFVTAIFITFGAGLMAGFNAVIGFFVARPRPTSPPIHVYMPERGIPSFPSGHVENDVVYYGFLLYLSFTKPVSQWRYRWILIPFQVYAVLNILFIGYSRVLEGSHWLIDALAGYLTGALCLPLLIVLYRWTLDKLNKWYAKRLLEKSTQNQQAG